VVDAQPIRPPAGIHFSLAPLRCGQQALHLLLRHGLTMVMLQA
jgi:hypothetical protein